MSSAAAAGLLIIVVALLGTATATLAQDRQYLEDPEAEVDTQSYDVLGPPSQDLERASFLQWILALLGYNPSKPPAQPPPTPIDPASCPQCKCGETNKQERIVGGNVTYRNQYPWMCLLRYHGKFYCGATLINSKYVLTASHCVHGFSVQKISVRCYEHDRDTSNETQHIDRNVARVVAHTGYSETNFNHDIAVLCLDEEISIQGPVRPVCLAPPKKSFAGHTGIVTGWGVKKTGGATSAVLQEVEVPIMSNKECRNSSYGSSRITDNMMCAGYPEGKKDSCQGDSGGPLHVVLGESIHYVVGVVSWGEGCAQPNHPGVYTRVNRYLTWIQKNTQDACYCQPPEAQTQAPAASSSYAPESSSTTESTYGPNESSVSESSYGHDSESDTFKAAEVISPSSGVTVSSSTTGSVTERMAASNQTTLEHPTPSDVTNVTSNAQESSRRH